MSYLQKKAELEPEGRLTVKDVDFLLKVLLKSTFTGGEVEQAYLVISKLSELHRRNIEG